MTQVTTSPGKTPNLMDSLKKKINKDLETTSKQGLLGGKNQGSQASGIRGSSNAGSRGGLKGDKSEIDQMEQDNAAFDLNLDDPYEDDDFNYYFDKASLLNHITQLEDDNLFKIRLVQEDEQNVEKIKKKAEANLSEFQKQIDDV